MQPAPTGGGDVVVTK